MSYHLLAYNLDNGINDVNVDMEAVVDPTFTRRGGASGFDHYIFTEQYNLLAAYALGTDLEQMDWNVPTWNAIARYQIWPLNQGVVVGSPPLIQDMRDMPIPIPMNEEIALLQSNSDAGGSHQVNVFAWITPPMGLQPIPHGIAKLRVRFTASVVCVAGAWSVDTPIVFDQQLKGGVYSIIGGTVISADSLAWRVNFPRMPLTTTGRKFYPGSLCTGAIGDQEADWGINPLGLLGRFMTFEEPQIQLFGNTGATESIVGFFDLVYEGPQASSNFGG